MGRRVATLGVVVLLAACAGTAGNAASGPDAHDRAAIRTLVALVTQLQRSFPTDLELDQRLERCPAVKALKAKPGGDAASADVAVKMLDRALLDTFQAYRTALERGTNGIDRIHPHAVVFDRWLRQVASTLHLLVQLVRTPTPHVAFCTAAARVVELEQAGKATQAAVDRAVDMTSAQRALIGRLVRTPADPPAEKAFVRWLQAAGYPKKTIDLLTG